MKNKEITPFELFELMKYDNAPRKIKAFNYTWVLWKRHELQTDYVREEDENVSLNFNAFIEENQLDNKIIEILPEENDEWQDIEMQFPDTFEEFIKSYSFVDDKEIYTNGSELIPTFRLQQWIEHKKEGNDEWEDIEEINLIDESIEYYDNEKARHLMNTNVKDRNIYIAKINQLIKNQKYLKERLDNVKDDVVFDYWKDKVESKDE